MCLCLEFDKNANSIGINTAMLVILISLATIGVCVFCAVTSVAALFIFRGGRYKYNYKHTPSKLVRIISNTAALQARPQHSYSLCV